MCKIMEDMLIEERKEIALRMIESGKLSFDEIAEYSGLPVETVRELAKRKSA